jgi:hypothetical protein
VAVEAIARPTRGRRAPVPPVNTREPGGLTLPAAPRATPSASDRCSVRPRRASSGAAFGCYLPDPHAAIARPFGLIVLTLEGDAIAAITWFAETAVFRKFGLPRTLPSRGTLRRAC